ncbi:MAG: hypothetical protein J4431_01965 [Candidatus Aenigmarchaeota archaeon]|nr:hypothetical protein [Candidatus Aenigmarchaeota archaeon]
MLEMIRFFFSGRREIYGLRKEYDKIREHVDRQEDEQKRVGLLRMLDQLEPNMVTLEEQKLSGGDTRKLKLYVRSSLLRIKGEMKRGPAMSARAVR